MTIGNERELVTFESHEPDAARATRLMAKACELGRFSACVARAQLGVAAKDDGEWALRACENGIPSACTFFYSRVHVQRVATTAQADAVPKALSIVETS